MLPVSELGKLLLVAPPSSSLPGFISAASGIARVGDHLYVVADDALHLGIFSLESFSAGQSYRLLPGELPLQHKALKAQKPDFEVLTHWQAYPGAPGGALLALGSGSRKNRQIGVLVSLDADGVIAGEPVPFSLAPIYTVLDTLVPELNIEGALFYGQECWLFQRGNSAAGLNAIIRMSVDVLSQCCRGRVERTFSSADFSVQCIDLGHLDGVPLGFTDAVALPDGTVLFSAAAEDTGDTYNDGQCAGSALGLILPTGVVRWIGSLARRCKVEGVAARWSEGVVHCWMATDADDASVPAMLLHAVLPPSHQ